MVVPGAAIFCRDERESVKSLRLCFRSESPSCWGTISLLLLVSSGSGLAAESEDSRAITSRAADSDPARPEAEEEESGSVEGEEGETEGPSFLRPTEESEVLEERRAGAEKVEDALPQG